MKLTIIFLILSSLSSFASLNPPLTVGTSPNHLILSGDDGEVVGTNHQPWDSSVLKNANKVSVIFYVDPDKKDINEKAEKAINAKNYNLEKYQSIAIINMDATILPNFILNNALESKQTEYPTTTYVKDYTKKLVKDWQAADDNYQIMVFNKEGSLVYTFAGELDDQEIQKLLLVIDTNLALI